MGLEDFDQTLILNLVGFEAFQFIAAGAESAARCMTQGSDVCLAFQAGVDQFFPQGADDTVATREYFSYLVTMRSCGFQDTASACIDNRGNATGLGIKRISFCHNRRASYLKQ